VAPPLFPTPPRALPPLLAPVSLNTLSEVTARGTLGGVTGGRAGMGTVLRAAGTGAFEPSRPVARLDVGGTAG
jgi:hypothetical protein